jgi:hydrogenase maturation protein HypF
VVLSDLRINQKKHLAGGVCNGLQQVGIMLPYTPLHHLLFDNLETPVMVLTSGNRSREPILIDNDEAIRTFGDSVSALLLHNRDIFNRNDDSVVRVMGGKERVIRRSRGYVPNPVKTNEQVDGIMAYGTDLTNSFCLGKGHSAILSQYIGDLGEATTLTFYEETLHRFRKLFRMKPVLSAVDLHPDYFSSSAGIQESQTPLVRVQHHHAHIASCMAEFGLNEKVIGVAFDGTGYGDDGTIWGSEFLIADLEGYQRKHHFDYLPLPGGDRGVEQPWRVAVAWLHKVFGQTFRTLPLPFLTRLDEPSVEMIVQMIDRDINCPLSCGAGRYFDAVAGLLGLCLQATFQAEGPMRLESILSIDCSASYPFRTGQSISLDPSLKAMVNDISAGISAEIVAAKFHNTIISVIFDTVTSIRQESGLNSVVLSGGVFQNKYILEKCLVLFNQAGFRVFAHEQVPSNDGGIALGQLVIASNNRSRLCV